MQALSLMPLSEITEASQVEGTTNSPFARTTCTHLARFVVIDAPAFNGRESGDTLLAKLRFGPFKPLDKLTAQPVDRISSSFLLFAADLDADSGDDAELERLTGALWGSMHAELKEVFQHCIGFDDNPECRELLSLRQALPARDDHAVQRLLDRAAGSHRCRHGC